MGLFTRTPHPNAAVTAAIAEHQRAVTGAYLHGQFGTHRMAVVCPKGGVGKTTVSAMLALLLAELRPETVMAMDANLHTGTLWGRLMPDDLPVPYPLLGLASAARQGLLRPDWDALDPYSGLRDGVRVLTNKNADVALVEQMDGADYHAIAALLCRAGQLLISDMGTSITSSWTVAALDAADTLVMATDTDKDTLESTLEVVSSLAGSPLSYEADPTDYSTVADGRYAPMIAGAVVVVCPGKIYRFPAEYAGQLGWLREVCGAVIEIPYDPALSGVLSPARLAPSTLEAYLRVTVAVAARFGRLPLSSSRTTRAS
jgi:hypothetical protein